MAPTVKSARATLWFQGGREKWGRLHKLGTCPVWYNIRHEIKEPIDEEWWHFTLKDEPYPDTYFDFPVKQSQSISIVKPE